MKLGQFTARTDPGRKRRGNEDSYVCRPPLFAIADGMGGARAGEVASALAAGALEESGAGNGGEAHVIELIQEANRRVDLGEKVGVSRNAFPGAFRERLPGDEFHAVHAQRGRET